MKTIARQYELPTAGQVFNLAPEQGADGARIIAEMAEQAKREREAREFAESMQRKLADVPGFIGVDVAGPESPSKVMLDPRLVTDAMMWLKRRFRVAEHLELSTDNALCVEIIPRSKAKQGQRRARFGKIEQFVLPLSV